jgi:UDP-glucose 4-epimerase
MPKVLVTGGTGYIGSHTIVDLLEHDFDVFSIDNFLNSDASPIKNIRKITGKTVKNHAVDLCDLKKTRAVFEKNPDIAGVIHFAALKSVGESTEQPLLYFKNNMDSLLNLLVCMQEFGIKNLIFSSSCSVYGNTEVLPVTESTPFEEAESPYARTKQMGEQVLRDFAKFNPSFQVILLRYFNPAGAHSSGHLGENPSNPAQALVPVITETAAGRRAELVVYGDDYDTRDGSCIRDFIHVSDIAHAHKLALDYVLNKKNTSNCEVFNLGTGNGVTVLEAIRAFEKVNKLKFNWRIGPRRAGDVVSIYANRTAATEKLGWTPKYGIEPIMKSAWKWALKLKKN